MKYKPYYFSQPLFYMCLLQLIFPFSLVELSVVTRCARCFELFDALGVVKNVSGGPCGPVLAASQKNPTTPRDTKAPFLADSLLQASLASLVGETCPSHGIGRCGSLKEFQTFLGNTHAQSA